MQTWIQDLRYGARMLRKQPGFTLLAVVTLALGIGANTTIFSVVNAVLLKALPFAAPENLVTVGATKTTDRTVFSTLSYPDFADLKAQSQDFERLAAYQTRGFTLLVAEGAIRLRGAVVEAGLFPLLGVQPLHGRTFTVAEDQPGGGRAVMLSHSVWQNHFGADPAVVGKTALVNGTSYTITGVMPPGFAFPIQAEPVELWVNFAVDREGAQSVSAQRGNHYLNAIGRLKPGVSATQAEAQLVSLASRLEQQYPNDNHGVSVRVTPLLEQLTGGSRRALWVIFAAVSFVLLIACINVAGLLLARVASRRHEISLRAALGASRGRLIRQLLTESLLLAGLGGGAGVLLASSGLDALIAITPQDIPRLAEARLDGRVLLFTLTSATLTGILMGLVPAWQASRIDLQAALKDGGCSLTGARASLRSVLVVVQIAVAVVLLVGAGLLIRSFTRLLQVNPGFDAEHLLTMRVGLPAGQYGQPRQVAEFHERLLAELATLPGVSAYTTVTPLPLTNSNIEVGFNIAGRPNPAGRSFPYNTRLFLVGADYFRTMGIALRQGREYTARDGLYDPPVALINETFARRFFPDQNPLGQRINPAMSADDRPLPLREIIGVVADARLKTLSEAPEPEVYLHLPQCPATGSFTLLLRTRGEALSLTGLARAAVTKLDRNVPLSQVRTYDDYFAQTLAEPRFNTLLLGLFAGLALLLTAIGLYGVLAYSVSQRTAEIGIRMALGARGADVLALVLRQGMTLALIGVTVGLLVARAGTRLLSNLLYDVSATDPLTFTLVALLLLFVALLACWIPARRATRVDPLIALRCE
jgi:putative ABC transport system permease protein